MKKTIKKILLLGLSLLPILGGLVSAADRDAPSIEDDFLGYLTNGTEDGNGEVIDVWTIKGVSSNNTLEENIRCIFYPNTVSYCSNDNSKRGGVVRNLFMYIGYALLVVYIVMSGVKLVLNGSNAEKVKSSFSSLLYILLGSLLFFGAIWILGSVLKLDSGTGALVDSLHGNNSSLLFFVLSFAKGLAFIVAIIMIVVHGFKMFSSADKSDKVKAGFKGLLNVIIALVIIKLIDYVYYIAQMSDLVEKATDLIIEIAKIIGFIMGALMVIMLLYSGFLLITDQGNTENMKKAKNIIIGILISAVVIFTLLLIIYQVFNEFA